MRFLNTISKFMYGRYGTDELNHFLLWTYLVCFVGNIIFRTTIIFLIELILIFFIFYRTFSKKLQKRRKENQAFLKIKEKTLQPFQVFIKNRKDPDHVYKKCRKCKKILRFPLPAKRGIKHTTCPNCKTKLTLLTLKYQKIEIIRIKK